MSHETDQLTLAVTLLETEQPTSADRILDILRTYDPASDATTVRYSGEDHDFDPLVELLGLDWSITWLNDGETYWTAQHKTTGDVLTYIEGDVYARDDRP